MPTFPGRLVNPIEFSAFAMDVATALSCSYFHPNRELLKNPQHLQVAQQRDYIQIEEWFRAINAHSEFERLKKASFDKKDVDAAWSSAGELLQRIHDYLLKTGSKGPKPPKTAKNGWARFSFIIAILASFGAFFTKCVPEWLPKGFPDERWAQVGLVLMCGLAATGSILGMFRRSKHGRVNTWAVVAFCLSVVVGGLAVTNRWSMSSSLGRSTIVLPTFSVGFEAANAKLAKVPVRTTTGGWIQFSVFPSGAEFQIETNGIIMLSGSPKLIGPLPAAKYTLSAIRNGVRCQTNIVTVQDAITNSIQFDLRPAAVVIETDPPGAEVFLGTNRLGVASPLKLLDESPGEHLYTLRMTWFESRDVLLRLAQGQTTNVNIHLVPLWHEVTNCWENMGKAGDRGTSSGGTNRWAELKQALDVFFAAVREAQLTRTPAPKQIAQEINTAMSTHQAYIAARNILRTALGKPKTQSAEKMDKLSDELLLVKDEDTIPVALETLAGVYQTISDDTCFRQVKRRIAQMEVAKLEADSKDALSTRRQGLLTLEAKYAHLGNDLTKDVTAAWHRLEEHAQQQSLKATFDAVHAETNYEAYRLHAEGIKDEWRRIREIEDKRK